MSNTVTSRIYSFHEFFSTDFYVRISYRNDNFQCYFYAIPHQLRSILSIVIELISLAQTPIDNNKYGFRVGKNPNGYDWGK